MKQQTRNAKFIIALAVCGVIVRAGSVGFAEGLSGGGIVSGYAEGPPAVRVVDTATGGTIFDFLASPSAVPGGVRVAVGDLTGDGVAEVVTGAGVGVAGGRVRVFDGKDLGLIADFFPFDAAFSGGVYVAAGDINGDGAADIIVGAGAGGGPQVKIFSGSDLSLLASFFAYTPAFAGGVNVAAGDVNFDGRDDIITGADSAGSPHVKVFSGVDNAEIRSFFAFDPSAGGVRVAVGDVNGDGYADIVAGSIPGTASHVKVFSGKDSTLLADFIPFAPTFTGGVYVAAGDVGGAGALPEILVATGPGAGSVSFFDGTGAPFNSGGGTGYQPFGADFTGGVFVAVAPPAPPPPTPTPEPTATPRDGRATGDFDNSGCTDITDFLTMLDYWQMPFGGGADMAIADFLALLDNWNTGPSCV